MRSRIIKETSAPSSTFWYEIDSFWFFSGRELRVTVFYPCSCCATIFASSSVQLNTRTCSRRIIVFSTVEEVFEILRSGQAQNILTFGTRIYNTSIEALPNFIWILAIARLVVIFKVVTKRVKYVSVDRGARIRETKRHIYFTSTNWTTFGYGTNMTIQ